jgi:hypothetical protein
VLVATALPATWEARQRIVVGKPVESYLARGLAEGIYPGLVYGSSAPGYAMMADPAFPEFSHSVYSTIVEAWRRARADPWPHLRWYLVDRWLTLWKFHMIHSPPIHIYPVRHGLFRPAFINPAGTDEPLAPLYWLFRTLYWIVVPFVLAGAFLALRARHAPATPGRRAVELHYVILTCHVVLHSIVIPEPRFMLPMRPVLFLLALAMAAVLFGRVAAPATTFLPGRAAVGAVAGVLSLAGLVVVAEPTVVRAHLQSLLL